MRLILCSLWSPCLQVSLSTPELYIVVYQARVSLPVCAFPSTLLLSACNAEGERACHMHLKLTREEKHAWDYNYTI